MNKLKVLVAAMLVLGIGALTVPTLLAQFGSDDDKTKPGRSSPWTATSMSAPSVAFDGQVKLSIVGPADPRGRPLLIVLHGRGGSPESWTRNPVPRLLRELDERAPVVIAVDGGESSYWYDRSTGDWEALIVDDVIPFAQRQLGIDPDRVGIAGFSMGGFGALSIAARNPGTFCVVGAHEPAIWQTGGESAAGAFDDAEDFERHDVIAAAASGKLDRVPIWLDRGRSDAFIPGQDALRETLATRPADVEFREYEGDHSMDVVRSNLRPAFSFYAKMLEGCKPQ